MITYLSNTVTARVVARFDFLMNFSVRSDYPIFLPLIYRITSIIIYQEPRAGSGHARERTMTGEIRPG